MLLLGVAPTILFFHLLMSSGNNSGGNRTNLQKSVMVPGSGQPTTTKATTKRTTKEANKAKHRRSEGPKNAAPSIAAASSSVVKPTGQERRLGKRALQLAAMAKKAETEDAYFRQCQRDAQRQKLSLGQIQPNVTKARETELFGTQTVQGINFAKYDDIQVEVKLPGSKQKDETIVAMKHFEDLALTLDTTLKQNIQRMRYTTPTPIQRHAIPQAMAGQDLLCCAQTGSGKTCAFLLPICAALASAAVENISSPASSSTTTPCSPRCIVLAPTRELASQIELEAQKLTYGISNVRPVAVYGGANQRQQLRDLAFGADIVVATPGRLTDFVERKIVSLANVQYLILDEADRMLDMGFEPQIRRLVLKSDMRTKERGRQTLMFSATFPAPIQKLAGEFMRPYVWIAVGRVGSTTESIKQVIVKATSEKKHKLKLVVEAIEKGPDGRTLVFVQKKRTATWLKKQLNMGGDVGEGNTSVDRFKPIAAEDIHGDRSQSQREKALAAFRAGTCTVLVATDVAARGLDISGVEHVINMDLPVAKDDFDSYVHRIGRTGRAGHIGLATSLYVPEDAPAGNNKIASLLVSQLREASQQVPPWLDDECVVSRRTTSPKTNKFGGIDVRAGSSGQGSRPKPKNAGTVGGRGTRGGGRVADINMSGAGHSQSGSFKRRDKTNYSEQLEK